MARIVAVAFGSRLLINISPVNDPSVVPGTPVRRCSYVQSAISGSGVSGSGVVGVDGSSYGAAPSFFLIFTVRSNPTRTAKVGP